jgi:hypothetical protein
MRTVAVGAARYPGETATPAVSSRGRGNLILELETLVLLLGLVGVLGPIGVAYEVRPPERKLRLGELGVGRRVRERLRRLIVARVVESVRTVDRRRLASPPFLGALTVASHEVPPVSSARFAVRGVTLAPATVLPEL